MRQEGLTFPVSPTPRLWARQESCAPPAAMAPVTAATGGTISHSHPPLTQSVPRIPTYTYTHTHIHGGGSHPAPTKGLTAQLLKPHQALTFLISSWHRPGCLAAASVSLCRRVSHTQVVGGATSLLPPSRACGQGTTATGCTSPNPQTEAPRVRADRHTDGQAGGSPGFPKDHSAPTAGSCSEGDTPRGKSEVGPLELGQRWSALSSLRQTWQDRTFCPLTPGFLAPPHPLDMPPVSVSGHVVRPPSHTHWDGHAGEDAESWPRAPPH